MRRLKGMIRHFLLAMSAWLCWPPVNASDAEAMSIYLIASEPGIYPGDSEKGYRRPAVLYRLEGNALRKTRTIATRFQSTETVQVFSDHGLGVVVSKGADGQSFQLDVLDSADMSTERSFDIQISCNGSCFLHSSRLLRREDRLIFAIMGSLDAVGGVYLDTWQRAEGTDQSNYVTDGYRFGQTGYPVPEIEAQFRFVDGELGFSYGRDTKRFPVDWSLPSDASQNTWRQLGWLIETDYTRVIQLHAHVARSRVDRAGRDHTWFVLNKRANQWKDVTMFGRALALQAFRQWIVFTDRYNRLPDSLDLEQLETQRSEGFLSAAERFWLNRYPPTGRFLFYNLYSGQLLVHDTGEPNSEVLYVDEQDRAYFRVSDELQCASLGKEDVGSVTVLSKQPELWAVHWLMMGSP